MELIDSRTVTLRNVECTVRVVADDDHDPVADYDHYSPTDVAAFRAGAWRYVAVHVETSRGTATVYAVEFGTINGAVINIDTLINDPYMTTDGVPFSLVDGLIDEIYEG